MSTTASAKCWEGDYRDVLRAQTLADLFGPLGPVSRRQLVLNRIESRADAAALADALVSAGHLDAWAWAEDMWSSVAARLGLPVTWFGAAWPYSAPELCELALANTPLLAHLAGDVRLLPGEPWLPRAVAALELPGVAAVSPRSPTGSELTEPTSRALATGWRGTQYFSDQCFVVRREEILDSTVMRATHPAAGRYPRPGGALTFEARVGAWLHSTGRWRAMDVERGYLHPVSGAEGDSYVRSARVPELLAELPAPTGYPERGSVDATAVVVAKNCERTVGAAVQSVQWCARVVLADVGSTDRTASVGAAAGASVVRVTDRDAALDDLSGWVVAIDANELVPAALAAGLAAEMKAAGAVWCARRTWLLGEEDTSSWPDQVRVAWHVDAPEDATYLPADRSVALIRFGPPGLASWWDAVAGSTTDAARGGVLSRRAPARIAAKSLLQSLARRSVGRGSRIVGPAVLAAVESWLWAAKAAEAAAGGEPAARAHYDEVAAAVLSNEPLPRPGKPS